MILTSKTDEQPADFTSTLFYSSIKPPSSSEPETQTVPFIATEDDFQTRYPKLAEEMRKYIQSLQAGRLPDASTSSPPIYFTETPPSSSDLEQTSNMLANHSPPIYVTPKPDSESENPEEEIQPEQENPDPEQELENPEVEEVNNELEEAENVEESAEPSIVENEEEIFPGYEDESENTSSADDEESGAEEKIFNSFIKKFDGYVDPMIPANYKTKFPSFFRGFDNWKFY